MKDIVLTIQRRSVRERAKELIANIAQKMEVAGIEGAYDRIVNVDSEDDFLNKFADAVAGEIRALLSKHLYEYRCIDNREPSVSIELEPSTQESPGPSEEPSAEEEGYVYEYRLRVSNNWQILLLNELKEKATQMMSERLVSEWMDIVKEPEVMTAYTNKAMASQAYILNILESRKRPYRQVVEGYKNDKVWLEDV